MPAGKRDDPIRLSPGGGPAPKPDPIEFAEASDWFRDRVPMSKEAWLGLEMAQRRKAYTVAGVAQLDVINDVLAAGKKAVATGATLKDFKKEIGAKVEKEWGGTVKNPGARLETIFRTNVQSAYSEGRYKQAKDPAIEKRRPYWRFDAVLDERTTSICAPLNGKVVKADDEWWNTHVPPLHFNCRSTTVTLTPAQAQREGIEETPPKVDADDGFGVAPGKGEWADQKRREQELEAARTQKQREQTPLSEEQTGRVEVKSGPFTEEMRAAVIAVASKPVVRDVLDVLPGAGVEFVDRISDPRLGPNQIITGETNPDTHLITIATDRPPGAYREKFKPGMVNTIAGCATDLVEACGRTYVHEVGHHISLQDDLVILRMAQEAFRKKPKNRISARAAENFSEYFAECFAAYVFHEQALADFDPIGYDLVLGALRHLGVIE